MNEHEAEHVTNATTTSAEESNAAPAAPPAPVVPAPVAESSRIEAIDVLRGFALLGILVMNIRSFAYIAASYQNPTIIPGLIDGADGAWWFAAYVLYDLKMMALFSMLFGAGIALMSDRLKVKGGSAVSIHYRRMGWLLLIGLIHAYGIWMGDILVPYALCGMLVFWARNRSPMVLIPAGLLLILVVSLMSFATWFWVDWTLRSQEMTADEAIAWVEERVDEEGEPVDLEDDEAARFGQLAAVAEVVSMYREFLEPTEQDIAEETAAMRGSWLEARSHRAPEIAMYQIMGFLFFMLWRVAGLMLVGMGLYRLGVLTGARSTRFYAILAVVGFALGVPVLLFGWQANQARDWEAFYAITIGGQYNYLASLAVAAGWIGVINLLCRAPLTGWLIHALASVGRMALTNYLTQSIVCTFLFHGWGPTDWFGEFPVSRLMVVVGAIWLVQLVISPLWLASFRYGPAEWVWRSLTYWKPQPMRR